MRVHDSRMSRAGLVKPKKVSILGYENAPGLHREGQLLFIRCTAPAGLSRAGYGNAPAPKSGGHTRRNVLVQMKANADVQETFRFPLVRLLSRSEALFRRNSSACSRSSRISSWISSR